MSAYDLLVPSGILILPVLPHAALIEQQWGQYLKPPPPGVYKTNDHEPVLEPNKIYYTRMRAENGSYPLVPIADWDNYRGDVLDFTGRVLISEKLMRNKETYLFNEPALPVRALKIIELLVNSHLSMRLKHVHRNVYSQKVDIHLKDGYEFLSADGQLENTCHTLFTQIDEFIGRDDWYIYFVKLNAVDIRIDKTIDYRVFEYEQQNEERRHQASCM